MFKFKIGDNVGREIDIYNKSKGYKIGKIIQRYSRSIKKYKNGLIFGPYQEMYKVKWNNNQIEGGFLPHGLDAL